MLLVFACCVGLVTVVLCGDIVDVLFVCACCDAVRVGCVIAMLGVVAVGVCMLGECCMCVRW